MVQCLECLELTVTSACSHRPSVTLGVVCQRLGQSQLEAAYSTGEVTEVGEKEVAGCDSML